MNQAGRKAIADTHRGAKLYGAILKRLERRKGANKGLLHHAIETEKEKWAFIQCLKMLTSEEMDS